MTKQKGSNDTESYWSNLWGNPKEYQNSGKTFFFFQKNYILLPLLYFLGGKLNKLSGFCRRGSERKSKKSCSGRSKMEGVLKEGC